MRKPTHTRGFSHCMDRVDKPNSVADDHLSGPVIAHRLERHSPPKRGTALHAGKDLLVAPPSYDGIIPRRESSAFRHRRHCRHLYPCGRRALPATHLLAKRLHPFGCPDAGHVRTFLPPHLFSVAGDRLTRSERIIPYIYMHVFVDESLDKRASAVY